MILYVNTGNAMDFCGRKCSAIEYYSKALDLHPFGMAHGNIGRSLEHYASLEGDIGHRAVLYKEAYQHYLMAEAAEDYYTYQSAKDGFRTQREQLEACFGREELTATAKYDYKDELSELESEYRQWCLENHLFLNTLNDLPEINNAFASDPLRITSIITGIDQKTPPFVFEMFDQIKEEYVYSRYLLYEVTHSNYELHLADRETHLDDVLNYSSYSIRLEKLKTSFRTLYSLFDRIAFLLNAYLELGIKETKVNYDGIWKELTTKEKQNIALNALHWINRDFKDRFGKADTPHTQNLKTLRNALEHKFVSIHVFPVDNEIEMGKDFIYRVSEDNLTAYTIDLLKLVREAVIELTMAIRIEEKQRHDENKKVAHITVYEYSDDFKR